jgi:hypothetical protein
MTFDATSGTTSQQPADGGQTELPLANGSAPSAASDNPAGDPGVSAKAAQPEGLDAAFWDADKGALRTDDAVKALKELAALKADADMRAKAVPAKADDYKVELPSEFKAPEGFDFKFDEKDPAIPALKAWAHGMKLDQSAVSGLLAIEAQRQFALQKSHLEAHKVEMASLGANAETRLSELKGRITAAVGEDGFAVLAGSLFTARQIQVFEALMAKVSGGGLPSPGNGGRAGAGGMDESDYNKLSFEQKIEMARKR